MSNKIYMTRSKTGLPLLSEFGGGRTNTGDARIICGSKGEKLMPVYVPQKGELSCAEHARVPVTPGCFIIEASHHREDFTISIREILSLDSAEMPISDIVYLGAPYLQVNDLIGVVFWANLVDRYHFSDGEWEEFPPTWLRLAVRAARQKATDYHCRRPWYVELTGESGE